RRNPRSGVRLRRQRGSDRARPGPTTNAGRTASRRRRLAGRARCWTRRSPRAELIARASSVPYIPGVASRPVKIALAALTVVLLLAGGSAAARVPARGPPRVWFAPLPPDLPEHAGGGSRDYMQLFRRGAKWQRAARHVKVFKIYSGWATDIARFSDLRRLILDLRRRKIALAAEVP